MAYSRGTYLAFSFRPFIGKIGQVEAEISCILRFFVIFFLLFIQRGILLGTASNTENVEKFFKNLFTKEFGYTLIGVKPVSLEELYDGYFDDVDINEECFSALRRAFSNSPNFALKIYSVGSLRCVELINRKAVRELVRRNVALQKYIRREFLDADEFYAKIEDPNQGIHTVFKKNARIIGRLFGYDETNIEYYIRRIKVGTYLQKYPLVCYHPIPGGKYNYCSFVFLNKVLHYEHLKPSKGFLSLEDEWRWIKDVSWDIEEENNPVPPFFVSLPSYICRHGGDSELTREKFKRASGKVAELFCNKSFQEGVAEIAAKK